MDKKSKYWIVGIGLGVASLIGLAIYYKNLTTINVSRVKRRAVELAKSEWEFWNKGKIKEGNKTTMQRLRDYWKIGTKTNGTDSYFINTPWSASFISYLFRSAGAKGFFKYNTAHASYINQAIKNRKEKNDNPFKGYRIDEVKIDEGDLVCYARQSGINYDNAEGYYMSHCDIVVNVDNRQDKAESIGGNVSNSVSETIVPLKNGKIDKEKEKKGYFVVIKMK